MEITLGNRWTGGADICRGTFKVRKTDRWAGKVRGYSFCAVPSRSRVANSARKGKLPDRGERACHSPY